MSEDERTVEAPAEEPAVETGEEPVEHEGGGKSASTAEDLSPTAELDRAAERFLDLEGELGAGGRSVASGIVTDAERVERSAAPADYPFEGDPAELLALTVDTGDGETTVYVAWPGGRPEVDDWRARDARREDTPLDRLLSAMGIGLGDLFGERVLLERVDGHLRVVTPPESPRSSGNWGLGVLAGQALNALLLAGFGLAAAVGVGVPTVVVLLWLALTLVGLPYVTWKDAWYVRTHGDWGEGPAFWAALSALPGLNLLAGVEYLRRRAGVTFFGDEPSLRTRLANRVRSLLG